MQKNEIRRPGKAAISAAYAIRFSAYSIGVSCCWAAPRFLLLFRVPLARISPYLFTSRLYSCYAVIVHGLPPRQKNKYVSDKNVLYLKCYYNSKSNCGGLYNCQTKHLPAETAGRNLSSLKANRPFTKRKASRMNHKDALTAELQRRIVNGMVAVIATATLRGKCIP